MENLMVYSYYSVQYWCVGAALLAKPWLCGWICRGFGKCAAWVGLTFGLVLSHIASFSGYTGRFVCHKARVVCNIVNIVNHIANFVSYIARFVNHIARFLNNIGRFVSYIVRFVGNIVRFLKRGAYFSNYTVPF